MRWESFEIMTTSELVRLGTALVNDAQARGITLRLIGGIGIAAQSPSIESNPHLRRDSQDVDLMLGEQDWEKVGEILAARGFEKQDETPGKQHWVKDDVTLDISSANFRGEYAIDFSTRLNLIPLTLPIADLLLLKLARPHFSEQDIQDSAALLVDHRVTTGGDEEQDINREHLYQVVNRDYRLWKTVFDNTVTLEKVFDKYLEPEEAQLAWRRIELLQEVLDGKKHSLAWWAGRVLTR